MKPEVTMGLILLGGLFLGALVGLLFGFVQSAPLDRHQQLQKNGRLRNAATIIPGSLRRIALLLIALVSIQLAFPMFFEKEGMQWVVSAGIVIGYGGALLRQASGRQTYRV